MLFKKLVRLFAVIMIVISFFPTLSVSASSSHVVSPMANETGPAGTAKLSIMSDRSTVWWYYKSTAKSNYYIIGTLTVTYTNGRVQHIPISKAGMVGKSISGTKTVGGNIKSVNFSSLIFTGDKQIGSFSITENKYSSGGGGGMRIIPDVRVEEK